MITKRRFLEVVRDRLSGGPAFADEAKNYPLPLIAHFVDMAMPTVLLNGQLTQGEMSVAYEFTPAQDSNGYYITLNPSPVAGILAILSASDDNGDFYVQDKATAQAFKTLRGSNKDAAILFAKNKLRFNRTPTDTVYMDYVPLISQMADDDQIKLSDEIGELDLYGVVADAVIKYTRGNSDKTNNDLTDPQ